MTTNPTHAVVVGIDGSDSSHGAFAHAVWEAHRRDGGNALTRLLLAAVGDVAVREAHCPVAVVPEPA